MPESSGLPRTPTWPPTDLSASIPCRRVTTSAAVRLRTLTKRMNKTADYRRVFAGYAGGELLCKERKFIWPQLLKQLESYEQAWRGMIDAAQENLKSVERIRQKYCRLGRDGYCWDRPPSADLWEHLRSLGFKL